MRKRTALAPLLIATLMTAAACGGSESDGTMTEQEARDFITEMREDPSSTTMPLPPVPSAAPETPVQTGSTRVGVADDPSRITLAEFEAVTLGMSYDTVAGIVGGPGSVEYQASYGEMTSVSYSWKGPEPEGWDMEGRASISFTNDAMTSKNQFGLD